MLLVALAAVSVLSNAVRAQTQSQMNQQAYQDFLVTDARLNRAYKQVMGKLDKQSQAKAPKVPTGLARLP